MKRLYRPGCRSHAVAITTAVFALLLAGTPGLASGATNAERHRGYLQEGLGQAIVMASNAVTPGEKAEAQEVLGTLITQAAAAEPDSGPVVQAAQMTGYPLEQLETRGEAAFWILAALGGTVVLLFYFFVWTPVRRQSGQTTWTE